ncbi:MAG: hypothetical protein MJ066_03240 [Clostridia bacterium]|nr:hypothetical protein [Clostridia bacterium]
MKMNITSKFKIFLIITLSILVLGMVFLGVFGFNKAFDYKKHCEVSVSVDMDVENSADTVKNSAIKFFSDKNVKYKKVDVLSDDLGNTFVFSFKDNVSFNENELQEAIKSSLEEKGLSRLNASVSIDNVSTTVSEGKVGGVIIALAIVAVLSFVYTLIMEKFVSAVSVLASSVGASVLVLALLALARIPVLPYLSIYFISSYILTSILSLVLVNRYKEISKWEGAKLSNEEIVNKASSQSVVRFSFIAGLFLVASVFMIAMGGKLLTAIGLATLVVDVVSVFTSFVWTPILWKSLKK